MSFNCVFNPPDSTSPNASEWNVFLGLRLINGSEEFETSLGVLNITVSKMTGSNIALLELFESVSFNNYIQPVCLDISDSKSFPIGSQCLVTGWENKNNSRGKGLLFEIIAVSEYLWLHLQI